MANGFFFCPNRRWLENGEMTRPGKAQIRLSVTFMASDIIIRAGKLGCLVEVGG
jgi:hypothetical protein